MTKEKESSLLEKTSDVFWIKASLWSRFLSRQMPLNVTDGIHMNVWPRVGALAPLVALFIGLLFGSTRFGYEFVYSESMLFLCVAILIGTFSANLGLMFLSGFIFGEFILATDFYTTPGWGRNGVVDNLIHYRIPLLITYGLLAIVIVKIPVMVKQLLVQISFPLRFNNEVKLVFSMVSHATLTGLFVYFWLQIMPVLIRPIFTWSSRSPNVEAMSNFQIHGHWLIILAIIASLLRIYLQSRTVFDETLRERMNQLEERADRIYEDAREVKPIGDYLNPWVRATGLTIVMTLVLSGLYELWLDGIILAGFIFFIQAARTHLIRVPLGKWPYWMEKIPLLFRLIGAFLIILYLSRSIIEYYYSGFQQSFRPIIVMTGLAMLFVYLLTPGHPKPESDKGEGGRHDAAQ